MAGEIIVPNYAATTFRKQFRSNFGGKVIDDSADTRISMSGGEWRSTAAVSRITLFFAADNIKAGSRCTLYGLT